MKKQTVKKANKKVRFVKAVYYREDGTTMTVRFPKIGCTSKKAADEDAD
jgi:hypothetical protein